MNLGSRAAFLHPGALMALPGPKNAIPTHSEGLVLEPGRQTEILPLGILKDLKHGSEYEFTELLDYLRMPEPRSLVVPISLGDKNLVLEAKLTSLDLLIYGPEPTFKMESAEFRVAPMEAPTIRTL